jgi:hypothetical protein
MSFWEERPSSHRRIVQFARGLNVTTERTDWSRNEVEATVTDYFAMLAAQFAGVPYNKTEHRRNLLKLLNNRSDGSVEFKHSNISAVLLELRFPSIPGYKPRYNYQGLLAEVVADRLAEDQSLLTLAAEDVERHIVVPEVDDILNALTKPPRPKPISTTMREPSVHRSAVATNYIEREARNRSLGAAGEQFVINFERARLIQAGKEALAAKIEHVSKIRGDGDGYDILSFDKSGSERLIEVKTTKYASETPFFVSRNELAVSNAYRSQYHLYRLFDFRDAPRLFMLNGALGATCRLSASTYMAIAA